MSTHVLVVTADTSDLDRLSPEERAEYLSDPDLDYRIECPGVTAACQSWEACGCEVSDYEAEASARGEEPEDTADLLPCKKSGKQHQQFAEFGLGTPSDACFVASNDHLLDAASDLELPPGRYPVTFDVEDEVYLTLHLIDGGAA